MNNAEKSLKRIRTWLWNNSTRERKGRAIDTIIIKRKVFDLLFEQALEDTVENTK